MADSMLAAVRAAATATDEENQAMTTPAPATAASPAPAPQMTADSIRRDHPEVAAQLSADGAKAERDRILGIEGVALAGHDKLIAEMKADGKTTPDQAARRIVEAEKANRVNQLQALKDADKPMQAAAAVVATDQPTTTPAATTPEGWKAEYEASEKLKAEYPTAESYVAVRKRDARKAA